MGGLFYRAVIKTGVDKVKDVPHELWDISISDIDGKEGKLKDYTKDKKAFLFVNVACKWGLTSDNYLQLVDLYNKYSSQGLQILGFPCGQFMNQELNTNTDVKNFVQEKFKVEFPMMSKIEVNGENMHPIYAYLKNNTSEMKTDKGLKNIPWNFAKFLVNPKGEVVGYFNPKISPSEILTEINKLLI